MGDGLDQEAFVPMKRIRQNPAGVVPTRDDVDLVAHCLDMFGSQGWTTAEMFLHPADAAELGRQRARALELARLSRMLNE